MDYVRCSSCGKRVSNSVPGELLVRAYIECPECIAKLPDTSWHDSSNPPEYFKRVLLYVREEYSEYPEQNVDYMISGYYHSDGVYCDYTSQTISGNERVLQWRIEPPSDNNDTSCKDEEE